MIDLVMVAIIVACLAPLLLITAVITWHTYRSQGRFPVQMYLVMVSSFSAVFLYRFFNVGFMAALGAIFSLGAASILYRLLSERDASGPGRTGTAYGRFQDGPPSMSVAVSRYVFGDMPFQVFIDKERAAEAYAGGEVGLSVPVGTHEVVVYRHRLNKTFSMVDMREGEGLFIYRDRSRQYQLQCFASIEDRAGLEEVARLNHLKGRRGQKIGLVFLSVAGVFSWAAVFLG
ncbi:MAG: hypothetical protein FWH47_06060 [Methanomassiliicoccaceae archaeon]|nr:hypothetical protein [Methanomassiliicoccaceae archaeon]